ncbi:MAG: response regulator [Desulfosarcinaceae bacterium]|nr:response regulator [Desulfosarcinaceae bacterium]
MKKVLIVDSDTGMRQAFASLLKGHDGLLNIHTVESGKAALAFLENHEIHLVITRLHMTGMDGLELVTRLNHKYPQLRVILMTSNASPMVRARLQMLNGAVHMDEATDMGLLSERVFTELQISYGGQVRGISLSSFLQMIELEACSCTLQVIGKDRKGRLHVREGELVGAAVEDLRGKAAALDILAWENVQINIDYSPWEAPREIEGPLMSLFLESRRIADERVSERPNQRAHDRYDCLVAVDYDLNNWTYQSFLRDISLGGAYVETEKPMAEGQRIILTLTTHRPEQSGTVTGSVVRKDARGVGIQFDPLTLKQRRLIQGIIGLDVEREAVVDAADEEPELDLKR